VAHGYAERHEQRCRLGGLAETAGKPSIYSDTSDGDHERERTENRGEKPANPGAASSL
jgi:hypothetical protein